MTETSLLATTDLDMEKSKPGSGGYPVPGLKAKVLTDKSILNIFQSIVDIL